MFSANAYVIRVATAADAADLERITELDSASPLTQPVLLGEVHGRPAAAISLHDNRTVADPFLRTAQLLAHLRMRAAGMEAYERTPNVADRIRAALRPRRPVAA